MRWLGLAGMLGAITLFAGDMLYYYSPDGGLSPAQTMATVSQTRLLAGGVSALFAGWLYLLGAGQFYLALRPAGKAIALVAGACFAATMVSYAVAHAAYFSIAIGAGLAQELHSSLPDATRLPWQYFELLIRITYAPIAVATILFIYALLKGRSHYPRWILPLFPTFPFLIEGLLLRPLEGTWLTILGGGFLNLIMLLFYAASTIALWRGGEKAEPTS